MKIPSDDHDIFEFYFQIPMQCIFFNRIYRASYFSHIHLSNSNNFDGQKSIMLCQVLVKNFLESDYRKNKSLLFSFFLINLRNTHS